MTQTAFLIHVDGYNDKIADLLGVVIAAIRDLEIRRIASKSAKSGASDMYRNKQLSRCPINRFRSCSAKPITESFVHWEERGARLPTINADAIRNFKQELLCRLHLKFMPTEI